MNFDDFFLSAHGSDHKPFHFQRVLACGEQDRRPEREWLASGTDARSLLLNVPTGYGKTAAVVLAWLWNRVALQRPDWPRRLVYCLPMRVLVEQTRDSVERWLQSLSKSALPFSSPARDVLAALVDHPPVILMGGEDEEPWDLYPERESILIGTQDMLLSRALNRGYAATRSRWPMHFGLLHTDCLWIFDEIQLMGPGLATTTQLEAFRHLLGSKDGHQCHSIWMSATMRRDWLGTVDFRDRLATLRLVELTEKDRDEHHKDGQRRWKAEKPLKRAESPMGDAPALASEVRGAHEPGTRTIVVVNTVRRACELCDALIEELSEAGSARPGKKNRSGSTQTHEANAPSERPEVVLLHSRFRPGDRKKAVERALATPPPGGTIVVSTQVIEAGVDVSATTLFTELAPWASLVQRFGRCNRRGDENASAAICWIDLPTGEEEIDKVARPYQRRDLEDGRSRLGMLSNVGPRFLPKDVDLPFEHTHVVRCRDLIDLFDTTPDLAGGDIDIDRFVRDVEETDVRVFWRAWAQPDGKTPPQDEPAARREELCPARVNEFREFAKKQRGNVWRWNFLEGTWQSVNDRRIVPGQIFLVHASAGGYSTERGWDPMMGDPVNPAVSGPARDSESPSDSTDADEASRIGIWQGIAQHTDEVCRELDAVLRGLPANHRQSTALRLAARWHDRGKAHEVFQDAIDDGQETQRRGRPAVRRQRPERWRGYRFVAKAPGRRRDHSGTVIDRGFWQRYERKHFRHELASALAILDPRNTSISDELHDLTAYIVSGHHGKVRLSLRSLPGEVRPRDEEGRPEPNKRFARGVWDGDHLPETDLGSGVLAPAVTLSLEPMELGLCEAVPFRGQPSWVDRMIRLRDSLGPFFLAYLEALLRAADMRASRAAERRPSRGDQEANRHA